MSHSRRKPDFFCFCVEYSGKVEDIKEESSWQEGRRTSPPELKPNIFLCNRLQSQAEEPWICQMCSVHLSCRMRLPLSRQHSGKTQSGRLWPAGDISSFAVQSMISRLDRCFDTTNCLGHMSESRTLVGVGVLQLPASDEALFRTGELINLAMHHTSQDFPKI